MVARVAAMLAPAERVRTLLLLPLMIVGMALEMLGIGLVVPALALLLQDDLAARYPAAAPLLARLGDGDPHRLVPLTLAGLVAVYLLKNLYLGALVWWQTRLVFRVQVQLGQRLFATYLAQPYTFHLQRNSAQLIRNLTREIDIFAHGVVLPGLRLGSELLVVAGVALLLVAVEPLGALLVVCLFGLASGLFHRVFRGYLVRWGRARQRHDGARLQHLQQGFGGAKEIKLLGREAEFLRQYQEHNARTAHNVLLEHAIGQMPRLWLELLAVAGLALLASAMLWQQRDLAALVPTLGLFAAAAFRLLPSFNRLLSATQLIRNSLPVIDTLYGELGLAAAPAATGTVPALHREIRLVDVSFAYAGATEPALHQVSLRIGRGEAIGLVGPSGSGKSTLVDVILGLLAPSAGRVEVDGTDIQAHLRGWQDQIGYVPQRIYLTDDSLRRNIAFGLADAAIDAAAVDRAVAAAQLDAFVAGLPDGLDTLVGERGVRLSGGQMQRIGIARALYHDPAVLVLDEATSALDIETEQDVMRAVAALRGRKTVLIAAHRASIIRHCQRVYRVDQGQVAELPAAAG